MTFDDCVQDMPDGAIGRVVTVCAFHPGGKKWEDVGDDDDVVMSGVRYTFLVIMGKILIMN